MNTTQTSSTQTTRRPLFATPGANLTVRTGIRGGAREDASK